MKTQIYNLVKGDHRLNISGSPIKERVAIFEKVAAENSEIMTVTVKGERIILKSHWSVSRKSCHWCGEVSLNLYTSYFGNFGLPKGEKKAYLNIDTNLNTSLTTNSKKKFYNYIPEKDVVIMNP